MMTDVSQLRLTMKASTRGFSIRANAFLINFNEPTLVDCGPATEGCYKQLVEKLAKFALSPASIRKIFITHNHGDHFGLAERIKAANPDVKIFAPRLDRYWMENFDDALKDLLAWFGELFRTFGLDEETLYTVLKIYETSRYYTKPVKVDVFLDGGEEIDLGGVVLKAVHTPGHTPGSMTYIEKSGKYGFTGDTLLGIGKPVPGLYRNPEDDSRVKSLPIFLKSLEHIKKLKLEQIYPGHGATIKDSIKAIDDTIKYYMDETNAIHECLKKEPMTLFTIYKKIYLGKGSTKTLPLVSRHVGFILGYFDLLEQQERISIKKKEGVYYYHAL